MSSLEFNNSIYIDEDAFLDCTGLINLDINGGESVSTLNCGSFENCSHLTNVTINSKCNIKGGVFNNCFWDLAY